MRLIMLDTETTGLSPFHGDRIVEIGAVLVQDRQVDASCVFHEYINPGRHIPEEVVRIHGIDDSKVKDSPSFAQIGERFLEFIQGSTLVIHNAAFDLGFIMNELALTGLPAIDEMNVIDTLQFARKKHPNQRNTLDALCDRYGIERGHRQLHGALLDSELLADVYLEMTGGKQFSLGGDIVPRKASDFVQMPKKQTQQLEKRETATLTRREPLLIREDDQAAHSALLERIQKSSGKSLVW